MTHLPLVTSLTLCGGTLAIFVSAFAQTPGHAPTPNLGAVALKSPPLSKKIVIVGSIGSQAPGEKIVSNAIPHIAAWLKASPGFARAEVLSYTNGWPADLSVLEGASGIVCYFDKPLSEDPARIESIRKLMDSGTGLVCIGQPSAATFSGLTGAAIEGEAAPLPLEPATPEHPVSAGVGTFTGTDVFAVKFSDEKNATPLLHADKKTVAWTYNRPAGGRAFAFTGGGDLQSPELRKLLVNAIAWTAKIEAPAAGVDTPEPVVAAAAVNRTADNKIVPMPWGSLRWFTSAEMKNSRAMTTGMAIISPGKSNPRHFHPNCDEVLHVISGKIRHTMNEVTVEMTAGDTVSIPQGVLHNATNTGDRDAVLAISFSSAYREAVGY